MVEQAPGICVSGVVVAENEFRHGVPAVHIDSLEYMFESIHNHVKAFVVFLILEDHLHQSATIIHPRTRPYSTTGVKCSLTHIIIPSRRLNTAHSMKSTISLRVASLVVLGFKYGYI